MKMLRHGSHFLIAQEMILLRFGIICGSAPENFRQKKLVEMSDFLQEKKGIICDSVVTFPSGISEMTLEMLLDNSFNQNPKSLYLYFCTFSPIKDDDFSFWLNGDEIRKEVIDYYQKLANELGIEMQVVFDVDSEVVSEEKLGYEKVESE